MGRQRKTWCWREQLCLSQWTSSLVVSEHAASSCRFRAVGLRLAAIKSQTDSTRKSRWSQAKSSSKRRDADRNRRTHMMSRVMWHKPNFCACYSSNLRSPKFKPIYFHVNACSERIKSIKILKWPTIVAAQNPYSHRRILIRAFTTLETALRQYPLEPATAV